MIEDEKEDVDCYDWSGCPDDCDNCDVSPAGEKWVDKISAGELRAIGCVIPDNIPDVATVPRTALIFGEPSVSMSETEKDTANITLPITVNACFSWHESVFIVEPANWIDIRNALKEMEAEGKIKLKDE